MLKWLAKHEMNPIFPTAHPYPISFLSEGDDTSTRDRITGTGHGFQICCTTLIIHTPASITAASNI